MDAPEQQHQQRSLKRLVVGVVVVVAGVAILASGIRGLTDNRSRLFAPEGFIAIETVDTQEDRDSGLSGRDEIADNFGMLFVFDEPNAQNCIWMKGMNFSIDIVWMDKEKRVINTNTNVSPDTYPETFCPTGDAKYGLELGVGRAEELGLLTGEVVRF